MMNAVRPLLWEAQNIDKTFWMSDDTPVGRFKVVCHGPNKWMATKGLAKIGGFFLDSLKARSACQDECQRLAESGFAKTAPLLLCNQVRQGIAKNE